MNWKWFCICFWVCYKDCSKIFACCVV